MRSIFDGSSTDYYDSGVHVLLDGKLVNMDYVDGIILLFDNCEVT